MAEQEIGVVTHYFDRPAVAVIKLTTGELATGDRVRFLGHTSDFIETVTSMEQDHGKVTHALPGDEVAIQVVARARPHDRVLKVV